MELAQAPFVAPAVLDLIGAWHSANPNATTVDGRCTKLAGLYGGAAGRTWALERAAVPTVSWLQEESATLDAMTAAPVNKGGMIALYPDTPDALTVDGGDPADELHVTLAFVAEDAAVLLPDDVTAIGNAAAAGAAVRSEPLLLTVVGAGTLGDSEPPATVLFLQQSDGDGTDHQDGVSTVAAVIRGELNDYGSEAFPAEHDGFIPHMTVGYGTPVADAQRLVGEQIKFSTGPTVQLGDIRQPHDWNGGAVTAAARNPAGDPTPLHTLARKATKARQRLATRVQAAAQVALRDALRRAGVKVVQKASRRSQAAKAAVAACGGRWTPAVLAAAGVTEQDLLRQAFDALGEKYEQWVIDAATEQLRAVADVLGLDTEAVLARMEHRMQDVARAASARLNEDLTQWAYRLLAEPEPSFGDVGEIPVDTTLPPSILQPSLALADGRNAEAPYGDGLLLEAWVTYDPQAPVEMITWVHGDPARPFEPHEALDGTTALWADYADVMNNDASFPRDSIYFPGDHLGCTCDYVYSYTTAAEAFGEA